MKAGIKHFAPDSQERGRVPFPSEERLKRTTVVIPPSCPSPGYLLGTIPLPLPAWEVWIRVTPSGATRDNFRSVHPQEWRIWGKGTDQSQSHQSQSLDSDFHDWEREALFGLGCWARKTNLGKLAATKSMPEKGTQRKAEPRHRERKLVKHTEPCQSGGFEGWGAIKTIGDTWANEGLHARDASAVRLDSRELLAFYFQNGFDFPLPWCCRPLQACSF